MAPVIRVRFIAGGGFVSGSIRLLTNSLWSHVEFGTPSGKWIGAHDSGGIQERAANYCAPMREAVYEIPCSALQMSDLLVWARGKIGTRYNFADIAGLMLHARSLRSPHRYICSQFCTEGLLRVFGAKNVLNVLPEYDYLITPETLHLSSIFVGHCVARKG